MLYDSNNSTRYKDALANYDARKYSICAPHDGTKGLSFRRFANDFLTNIATFDLKDPNEIYDLSETLLGLDEGRLGGRRAGRRIRGPAPGDKCVTRELRECRPCAARRARA